MFRNVTLKCLTEIAGVSVNQYEEQFVNLFTLTMCQLKQVRAHLTNKQQRGRGASQQEVNASPILEEKTGLCVQRSKC